LLGLVVGSFLNVCIYRIPEGRSITYPPSRCPECRTRLSFRDLIPVLSWFMLKGHCAYCFKPISWRYPLVEGLTGLLFFLAWVNASYPVEAVKWMGLFAVLIVIAFIDLDYQIIPDTLVLSIFLWGLFWQIIAPVQPFLQAAAGFLLGGGILFLTAVLSKGGMGGGDIKLLAAAGFILGPVQTALALFVGVAVGSLVGVTMIWKKMKKRRDYIAFGPFLALGIVVTSLWGSHLLDWYLSLIGW